MKKYIAILLAAAMATLGISACRKENSNKETKVQKDSDIKVVTTIFPEYDWVRQIAGEEADQMDITMLLDNGVDLHSYQPTAEDIMKVSDCDLFVYVGGESDAWVDDALKQAKNKDMQVYRQQGKIEALKAAQKKAGYLVEALGKRLGDVIRIVEPQESAGYPRYFAAQSNVSSSQSEAYDAFRTIKLNYSMLVRFEIK